MRRFFTYTAAQFKRAVRYFPFIFLVTFTLSVCLALVLVSGVNSDNSDENKEKISIGIVGSYEDNYLGFGVSAIQSLDSSRFALNIIELEENEAKNKLMKREISGYVLIPDDFINDALHGNVGKLSFVTTHTNADVVNIFKQEVLELVSCILVESQNGVYGMRDALHALGATRNEISDKTASITAEYVSLIIARSNAFEVEIIGISDNLTFGGYMFSGICVLLLLLSGIVATPLFVRRDASLYKLLSANRYRSDFQISGEYLSFFLIMLVNTFLLMLALILGVSEINGIVPELSDIGFPEAILILVKFIPAIALITSLQFLMYQLADSIISGVLMQFISAVLLGYVAGCFYPISFFPKLVRVISDFLPAGMARKYLSSLLTGSVSPLNVILIASYFVAFTALSVFTRYRKIKAV